MWSMSLYMVYVAVKPQISHSAMIYNPILLQTIQLN